MIAETIKIRRQRTRLAILQIIVLLAVSFPALAQEPGLDEALSGFGEERSGRSGAGEPENALEGFDAAGTEREAAAPPAPAMFDLTGSLTLSAVSNVHQHQASATGTDYGGLSRLRVTLDLGVDARLSRSWDAVVRGRGFYDAAYRIRGREKYTAEVLGSLEDEAELREAFLRGKVLPWLDMKVGRQIVVWGKSDNLRVTDVLNPLDSREPGMVDIEDLRIPLAMAKLDAYTGPWNLSAIAIPEIRFDKRPPYGSDFSPSALPPPPETVPDDGGGNTEYAFALNGILTGWDISFYTARIFNDQPSARFTSFFPFPQIAWVHDRVSMQGAAVNVAAGNWLFKTEAARFSGLRFAADPGHDRRRVDGLLGVEYSGFTDTMLSMEIVHRRLLDHDATLAAQPDLAQEDEVQAALRVQRDFLHDRLQITGLALRGGWDGGDGAMQRLSARYEVTDRFAMTGGYVNYRSGDRPGFGDIGKNDRLFVEAKYSF